MLRLILFLLLLLRLSVVAAQQYSQYTSHGIGGLALTCLGCSVSNGSRIGDPILDNYALMQTLVNVAAYPYVNTTFGATMQAGSYAGFVLQHPGGSLLTTTLLGGLEVSTMKEGNVVETFSWNHLLTLTLLPGTTARYKAEFFATAPFDGLQLRWPALPGALNQVHIYEGYGSSSSPLPVQSGPLSVEGSDEGVVIRWTTYQEEQNSHFQIERSTDGKIFVPIGRLAGQGTTRQPYTYQFVDRQSYPGQAYYRTRQVDANGNFQLSKIVAYTTAEPINKAPASLHLYPNPARGSCHFRVDPLPAGQLHYQILTLSQQPVQAGYLTQTGNEEHTLLLNEFPPGLYTLRVYSPVSILQVRLITVE